MDRPDEPTPTPTPNPSSTSDRTMTPSRGLSAVAGLGAAAVGLGVAEFVAGVSDSAPSLLIGVGDAVIDIIPGWLDRAAIDLFGHNDKTALIVGTLIVAAIIGAGLGVVARHRFIPAASGYLAFALIGVAATISQPGTSAAGAVIVGSIGAAVSVGVLWYLFELPHRSDTPRATGVVAPELAATTRRTFLISATAAFVVGALAGLGGWVLSGRERVDEIRRAIRLPRPIRRAQTAPAGAELGIPGLTPLYVPNDEFYRIDTALIPPAIDPADWHLDVRGRVDHPYSLSYDELMALPQIEADITLACVSNEVGGDLVGNARWQGVPLRDLLTRAVVRDEGAQIIGHSTDGFTAGFPVEMGLTTDNAMVAVAMNGTPLPVDHGFPARLVVPGLYGYVSATKWLTAIEVTGWDTDGYWIPRGWSKKGPIKTEARVDVPRRGSPVAAGPTVIAGVAWAPTRGIDRVEVKIDDGPWRPATLADSLGVDTWRQWHGTWDLTPGSHTITARATDGTGTIQTVTAVPPAPDGASGYPSIQVTVEA